MQVSSLSSRQSVSASFTTRRVTRSRGSSLVVRAATALPSTFKSVAPVGDRVFVKTDVQESTTAGGLLLPTNASKNKPTKGEIVGVGKVSAVKVGDKVVYSRYAGTEVSMEDSDYIIMKEDDVIGVLSSTNIADLKPLGDRILIEVAESEEQSQGGVLLTGSSQEKPTLGNVVAVGAGREGEDGKVDPPNVSVGSTVLYSKYSGVEFEGENDKQYVVVREADILANLS